jgi:hypothetical protein
VQLSKTAVSTRKTPAQQVLLIPQSESLDSDFLIKNFIPDQIEKITEEEKFWGDDIRQQPSDDDHRIYFQNLDGMLQKLTLPSGLCCLDK